MRRWRSIFPTLAVLVLVPGAAAAQTGGTFTGEVTDNTGGVLPGVTVEASSPVLIEGARTAFSDGAGRYTIVDLFPGPYILTFTLPGFSTVIRDQLQLPASFTMTIDAELSVGALEETVTVSGASPVVDVQTTARAEVLNREILDAVPTGNNLQSTAQLIVGVKLNRPEVGLTTAAQQTYMSVHGMSPSQVTVQVDGQSVNNLGGDGATQNYHNHLASEEMVYETSGMTAETSGGGVRVNMIPRQGGNAVSGQAYFGGSIDQFQADGLEAVKPRTLERGVAALEGFSMMYDLNVALGGPIVRDKFWYFGSIRNWQIDKKITNSFYRTTNVDGSAARFFNPAPVRLDGVDGRERVPGIDDNTITSGLLRLTWQASDINKFTANIDRVFKNRYHLHDANTDIDSGAAWLASPIYYTSTAKWTSTISSRLLFEAGYSSNIENWAVRDSPETPGTLKARPSGVLPCFVTPCYHDDPRQYGDAMDPWYQTTMRRDIETEFRDRYHWGEEFNRSEKFNYHISLSYVTGSHNTKMGIMNGFGPRDYFRSNNADIRRQQYRNGVPEEVRVTNWPLNYSYDVNRDMGIYVQDTWTIDRLTLNLGLRWEHMRAHNLATDRVQGRFVPAAVFPEGRDLPNWKDAAPRLGLAYDLFGDASTALKVSWGRYNAANMYTYQSWFHPAGHTTDNRDWFDCALSPGDPSRCASSAELAAIGFDPDIAFGAKGGSHAGGPRGDHGTNGDDYVQDWEIGTPDVIGFGGAASRPVEDPNGVERNWVGVLNVGVERELLTGLSVAFNWYHRDTYDSVLRVNRALNFADYTALTIPNPCAENPNAGFIGCSSRGIQPEPMLRIYNLDPAKKGVTDWVVTNTTNDPDLFSEVYNGYESSFNARLPGGTTLFGGWTFERNLFTRCDIPHDPNRQLFCNAGAADIPFMHEFKVSGSVPLPGGFMMSGSAQFYPGQEVVAGGGQDQWGGTHRGGELTGARPYNGNINYTVPPSAFEAQGMTRTSSFVIPLMPPGALFYDRLTQVDVSLRKTFTMAGGMRMDLQLDVYNIIDAQPITNGTNTYGNSLGKASRTIQSRFLQIATHLHW